MLTHSQQRIQKRLEKKITSICEMYLDGKSLRQIADMHKTSHETIRQILKNHGIITSRRLRPKIIGARIIDKHGYIHVFIGESALGANKDGYMLEHRKVMQDHLGRMLTPWEIIHHRNRDKANNEIENLELTIVADHASCLRCPYYEFYVRATGNQKIPI